MAPIVAQAADKPAHRTRSRIVPAIPHRLSRAGPAPSPVTPETSNNHTQEHEIQLRGEVIEANPARSARAQPPARAADAPLTPDSHQSAPEKPGAQIVASPANPAPNAGQHDAAILDSTHTDQSNGASIPPQARRSSSSLSSSPPPSPAALPSTQLDQRPATNGTQRKLAVPTELPPPFYPSINSNHTTVTADKTTNASSIRPRSSFSTDPPGAEEQQLTLELRQTATQNDKTQQPVSRPRSAFAPEFIPASHTGHRYHQSDAGDAWSYPLHSLTTSDFLHGASAELKPSHLESRDVRPNGYDTAHSLETSLSLSPSKSQWREQRSGSEQGDGIQPALKPNHISFQPESLEESPFELATFLSRQFGKPDFADYILQVRSPDSILVSMPVHGIIIVRSSTIAEAIGRSTPSVQRSRNPPKLLDVLTVDPLVTCESVEETIKVLYGAPLLSAQTFLYGVAPYDYESKQAASNDAFRRMRQLLSYVAAGRLFQMLGMQHRGVEIARMLLRWDTIDQVLHFALRPSAGSGVLNDDHDFKDPFVSALLDYAVEFMAYTFPRDFKFFSIAPELEGIPRLPPFLDARPSTHHSRLSKIRFGDAPPEDDRHPSYATRMLSSILVSVPLWLLDRLFNHPATGTQIGWPRAFTVMRDVLNERECRRRKCASGQVERVQKCTTTSNLMNNLRTEERIEQVKPTPLHPSGYRFVAVWAEKHS